MKKKMTETKILKEKDQLATSLIWESLPINKQTVIKIDCL